MQARLSFHCQRSSFDVFITDLASSSYQQLLDQHLTALFDYLFPKLFYRHFHFHSFILDLGNSRSEKTGYGAAEDWRTLRCRLSRKLYHHHLACFREM